MDDPLSRLDAAVARLAALTRDRPRTGTTHDDADEVAGTVATDDAIGFDPRPLLRALDRAGVEVVVMGQVAGILHGSTELTGDLDLLWDGRAEQRPGLAAALASVGAALVDDDDRPVPCDEAAFALAKVQLPPRRPAATAARRRCRGAPWTWPPTWPGPWWRRDPTGSSCATSPGPT